MSRCVSTLNIDISIPSAGLRMSRIRTGLAPAASENPPAETVSLRADRTIYWSRRKILLAADLHWGKPQTFRHHGIPIPEGILQADLDRLTNALRETGAKHLFILGDLIHARQGLTPDLLEAVTRWRSQNPVAMTLIRGNHDRHCKVFPSEWNIDVRDSIGKEGPFAFAHHPEPVANHYVWAGHVHPTVSMSGVGDRLRMPCFHIGAKVGILPAFSIFTGGFNITAAPGERVFSIAGEDLVAL